MAGGIDTAVGASIPGTGIGTGALVGGFPFWDWLVKNQLIPAIIDGRNNEVPLFNLLYQRKLPVAGKFILRPVRDGRNYAGISAIHPDGNMPDPGSQGAYMYALAVRDIYLRMKVHNQLLHRAGEGDEGALVDLITYETEGLMQDLAIKQEIMMHGDGSGRRAEVAVDPVGAIDTMQVRLNQDNEGVGTCTSATNLYLDVGMRVAIVSPGGTVRVGASGNQAYYVHSKPSATGIKLSLTLGGIAIADMGTEFTLTAGDWIVDASRDASMSSTSGIPLDTGWRQEPMGLAGIFRDVGVLDGMGVSVAGQQSGAYDYTDLSVTANAVGFQGVPVNGSPTNYNYPAPSWNKANVYDNAAVPQQLTETLLQRLVSDPMRVNNAKVKKLVSDWDMYNAYVDTLIGDKRFMSTVLAGGHTGDLSGPGGNMGGATFNGLEWFKSRFALGNQVIGIDPEQLHVYENRPLGVSAPPGHTPFERMKDKDAFWKAFMTSYNMFCDLRQRVGGILVDVY